MCEFQSLYFEEDAYVIRCKQCGQYQLGFGTIVLTLTTYEFHDFYKLVKYKYREADQTVSAHGKTVILRTPSHGIYVLLTLFEAARFCEILEAAENEGKALTMISMFNGS